MSNPPAPTQKPRVPTITPGLNADIDRFMGMIPPDALNAPLPPVVAVESAVKPEEAVVKTPYEDYIDSLKELKITPEEAANMVDNLITQGFYEESFLLNKKFPVKFRTRNQESTARIDRALSDKKPEYNSSVTAIWVTYNLASSLVQYGKYICKPYESDEEFEKTLKLVQKIPQPIFQMLIEQLSKFDQKLLTVSNSSAVITNF